MAYVTGIALSLEDLLTAIRSACVANGWMLTGNVLSKDGCYAEVMLSSDNDESAAPWPGLRVRVGNGVSGVDLVDPAPGQASLRPLADATGNGYTDWSWPVTYHIHIMTNPDEVFVFVNYDNLFWQNIMFGKSPAPGNVGTGNWFSGTLPRSSGSVRRRRVNSFCLTTSGAQFSYISDGQLCGAPFFWDSKVSSTQPYMNSQIHGVVIDNVGGAIGWSSEDSGIIYAGGYLSGAVSSASGMLPLLSFIPGAAFNSIVLLRCQILQGRAENKVALVGELGHLRFTRNDFLADGELISLGDERWKIYPFYRKEILDRDPSGSAVDHSGTLAMAIRYDGP